MTVSVNGAGVSHARSLISAGKVNKDGGWSFSSEDGNRLLGSGGDDWAAYGAMHLAVDSSEDPKTKAHWKYPFGKGGEVYRSGLVAIRSRAGQQSAKDVFDAAGRLIDEIDKRKSMDAELQLKDFVFEFKDVSPDAGTFSGYGAVFGNVDGGGDVIMPGAFRNAIGEMRAKGKMPKMLWQHDTRQPIGVWTGMSEDSHGLKMDGKLALGVRQADEAYSLIKMGALDGLSIGYIAKDWEYNANTNNRVLKELEPMEVSVVTMPMNGLAGITAIKAANRIRTKRDFEAFLRDEGGFSNAAAKAITAGGFKSLDPRDEDDESARLLETLRQVRAELKF